MEVKQTQALIMHGWDDDPSRGWVGWLGDQLRVRGYDVLAPHFPTIRRRSDIGAWHEALKEVRYEMQDDAVAVGHSLGCWQILRMLELPGEKVRLRTAVLVSGFYDASDPRAHDFFRPEPDWGLLKSTVDHWICILSRDDQIVAPDRTRALAGKLSAELVELEGHGHFLGSKGMYEFPEILEYV
ncbi:alpha/beta hydrolase [bacterium]|nr:alpha/beta hydrolase [bacterium]